MLRSIKTLETINGKPAAEFWKEVESSEVGGVPAMDEGRAGHACRTTGGGRRQEVAWNSIRGLMGNLQELIKSPEIENGIVSGLGVITDNVTDISPVRALGKLSYLVCAGSAPYQGKLVDLSPLKGMPLTELHLQNCLLPRFRLLSVEGNDAEMANLCATRVADLSPLRGLPLAFLSLHGTHSATSRR